MDKKTKILYIITKSVWAGAGKYVYDLATALPQTKFRTVVAAGGTGPLAQKIISSGIPYFEIKNFQRDISIFKEFFAFFEILFLLYKTKPDIIHVSSAKAGGIVGLASKIYSLLVTRYSLRTIFTVHGWTFNEPRPEWQIFLIKFFSRLTCVFYDKIICVSEYDYQSAIKNNIAPKEKLTMIHNGIKPEDYNFLPREEARNLLRSRTPKSDLGVRLLTVGAIGEFTKNKGQKYLIDAINLLVTGIVIGFGEEYDNLKLKIRKLKLENKIFLIKNLPNAANHLKAFDIFVLPSLKEGLPYVLLEAGLAEIPIIATNVGGVPEIIENEKTGLLIKPANPDEITDALKKLINNPELAKALAANARQKILSEFSFEKMLQQTLAAYEN